MSDCYNGAMTLDPAIAARLKRNDAGLVAAVAQERGTGDVLMVAWMDDEALARTLETRKATYFSRSRQQYWVKGRPPATPSTCTRSGSTAMATPSCWWSIKKAPRATPERTPVSMPTSC